MLLKENARGFATLFLRKSFFASFYVFYLCFLRFYEFCCNSQLRNLHPLCFHIVYIYTLIFPVRWFRIISLALDMYEC